MNRRVHCRGSMAAALLALAALLAGCGSNPPPRFLPGPAIERIADDVDIPEPAEIEFNSLSHNIENFTLRQARNALSPLSAPPALDVNRLGEVPDSAWFTNRIAGLDPAAAAAGPMGDDPGPEAFTPWTVTGLKIGGRNAGFNFEDSRGARYICKFDKPGRPVISTAAGAIAARLFWALGYFAPDDRVVHFDPGDLRIAPGAKVKEEGGKRALTRADIDRILASVPARADGRRRALVSRFLDGSPRGGYEYTGTRGDDPNDRIPHQRRRSLRALRVFGAWLNHVDVKHDNTLDLYVAEGGRRFLRHYLVDFDGCLGGFWASRGERRIGFAYDVDFREILSSLPLLGMRVKPYETLGRPPHPQIGLFESEVFDPARWRPNYVNDAIESARPADIFWAGTVLAKMSDQMIEACVATGRCEDPAAQRMLADILKLRRDKTLRWALTAVSPVVGLDDCRPVPAGLLIKAADLPAEMGLIRGLCWRVEVLDAEGARFAALGEDAAVPAVLLPADLLRGRDYVIVRWTATGADGRELPPTEGHYGRGVGGWGLWGILRNGE